MSLGALAARLYTIQSRKGGTISSALSDVVKENLAVRFSVYSLVKTITKSETLATIAQAKYGKKTPQQKKEDAEKRQRDKNELKFKQFTVSSIVSLNRKINALASVTQRNTELIASLYSDLGAYRGKSRININQSNPKLIRAPLREKTVKGKIDKINADLEMLKEITKKTRKKRVDELAKPKQPKPTPEETGGLLSTILGGLVKNPLLMAALMGGGRAGKALALGRYGLPAIAMLSLPRTLGNIGTRLSGQTVYSDPLQEKISQGIAPLSAGLGTYTAGMLLTNAYRKISPKGNIAERLYEKRSMALGEETAAKKTSLLQKYRGIESQRYATPAAQKMAPSAGNLEKFYNQKLQRVKTYQGMQRVLAEYEVARKKASEVRTQRTQTRTTIAGRQGEFTQKNLGESMRARIAKTVESKRTIGAAKNLQELRKWNKLASGIESVSKRIPSITAAYIVYKISQMSNYVAQKGTGELSPEQFKRKMVESYSDLASTLGTQGVGALLGGLVGTAIFPGVGTAALAAVGGAAGLVAGLFLDNTGASEWIGEKLFELLHEDRPYRLKKKEEFGVGAEKGATSEPTVPSGSGSAEIQAPKPVEFKSAGKVVEVREGGSLNWRNNNPGNIRYGEFAKSHGAIGENAGFAIFPTMEIGRKAADDLLRTSTYKDLTITQAIARWAPASDNNDPNQYVNSIVKMTGIDPNKKYVDLSAADKGKFLDAMYRIEGGKAGTSRRGDALTSPPTATVSPMPSGTGVSNTPVVVPGESTPGVVVSPPPTSSSGNGATTEGDKQVVNAAIQSQAALMASARLQQNFNVVATETAKIRNQLNNEQSFPSSRNPDLENYA